MDSQCSKASKQGIRVSVVSSEIPPVLTKTYSLVNGSLEKVTTAQMCKGYCEVENFPNMTAFGKKLTSLKHNQALCFGIPSSVNTRILSTTEFKKQGEPEDAITRTKENFNWSKDGIFFIDYDPVSDKKIHSLEEFKKIMYKIIPTLSEVDHCLYLSSSSFIYNTNTGEEYTGSKGLRLYVRFEDGFDIPRAGKVLAKRLLLAGYGHVEVGVAGQFLIRTLVDTSVWQTNRLDFASGADCQVGLEQRRGEPTIYDFGIALDSKSSLPDLTKEEEKEYLDFIRVEKNRLARKAELNRLLFVEKHVKQLGLENISNVGIDSSKVLFERMLDEKILSGAIQIQLENTETVSVEHILKHPEKYHGMQVKDPIEPDYRGGKICGILYLDKKDKFLHSQAHGGQTYRLLKEPKKIEYRAGELSQVVEDTFKFLKTRDDIFEVAGKLAMVYNGNVRVFKQYSLMNYLGLVIQYYRNKVDKNGGVCEQPIDPPTNLVKQILDVSQLHGLRKLAAVITTPILRLDGSLLNKTGYDEQSQLYLDYDRACFNISSSPSISEVKLAIETLMFAFENFPFSAELDKSVMLAALLSSVLRPVLPTCPAFAFDAPLQGSGKTLLAQCVGALVIGKTPSIYPYSNLNAKGAEDEIKKFLLSILINGELAVIWDNLLGVFSSAVVASMLTSSKTTGRLLNTNDTATGENKCLLIFTGNNLHFSGDMPRRVLTARIDPKIADPTTRNFEINPLKYVLDNRSKLVSAAITICRGWFSSEEYKSGVRAKGRAPSFEAWDDLVRQTVAWISRIVYPNDYCDVIKSIQNSQESDPEREQLYGLLLALHNQFLGKKFSANDIVQCAKHSSEIFEAVGGMIRNRITPISVGKMLKFRLGRIVERLSLQIIRDKRNGHKYWIKEESLDVNSPNYSANETVVAFSTKPRQRRGFKPVPPRIPSPPTKL